jgi:hypothetical protein
MRIKALTIWQPWASLIVAGFKPYEFRGWPAPRGLVNHRIAIHAGARPVKPAEVKDLLDRMSGGRAWTTGLRAGAEDLLQAILADPARLPLGHVLATATLGQPRRIVQRQEPLNDSDRDDHAVWAWPLSDIKPLTPPVPARGAQGFWSWAP